MILREVGVPLRAFTVGRKMEPMPYTIDDLVVDALEDDKRRLIEALRALLAVAWLAVDFSGTDGPGHIDRNEPALIAAEALLKEMED